MEVLLNKKSVKYSKSVASPTPINDFGFDFGACPTYVSHDITSDEFKNAIIARQRCAVATEIVEILYSDTKVQFKFKHFTRSYGHFPLKMKINAQGGNPLVRYDDTRTIWGNKVIREIEVFTLDLINNNMIRYFGGHNKRDYRNLSTNHFYISPYEQSRIIFTDDHIKLLDSFGIVDIDFKEILRIIFGDDSDALRVKIRELHYSIFESKTGFVTLRELLLIWYIIRNNIEIIPNCTHKFLAESGLLRKSCYRGDVMSIPKLLMDDFSITNDQLTALISLGDVTKYLFKRICLFQFLNRDFETLKSVERELGAEHIYRNFFLTKRHSNYYNRKKLTWPKDIRINASDFGNGGIHLIELIRKHEFKLDMYHIIDLFTQFADRFGVKLSGEVSIPEFLLSYRSVDALYNKMDLFYLNGEIKMGIKHEFSSGGIKINLRPIARIKSLETLFCSPSAYNNFHWMLLHFRYILGVYKNGVLDGCVYFNKYDNGIGKIHYTKITNGTHTAGPLSKWFTKMEVAKINTIIKSYQPLCKELTYKDSLMVVNQKNNQINKLINF